MTFSKLLSGRPPGRSIRTLREFTQTGVGEVIEVDGVRYQVIAIPEERIYDELDAAHLFVRIVRTVGTREKRVLKVGPTMDLADTDEPSIKSAVKESEILRLVQGNRGFVQGVGRVPTGCDFVLCDMEYMEGPTLPEWIKSMPQDHKTYYRDMFPFLAARFADAARALHELHEAGRISQSEYGYHGDMGQGDCLIYDQSRSTLRWFDLNLVLLGDRNGVAEDINELGKIFRFIVGKRLHTVGTFAQHPELYPHARVRPADFSREDLVDLGVDDLSLLPVVNLGKLFPYISDEVNALLMQFRGDGWDGFRSALELAEAIEAVIG